MPFSVSWYFCDHTKIGNEHNAKINKLFLMVCMFD